MAGGSMTELLALTTALQHASSLESMLAIVADRTASILGCARTSVRLLDEGGTRLLVGARSGAPLHDKPLDFARGEGLIGWIAQEKRPIRSDAPERDPRFVAREGMTGTMGAFLGVPLLEADECFGVLSVLGDRPFVEQDEQLLLLVAGMAAPHLQIARLRRLAQVDPLTGTLNRRGFEEGFSEKSFASAPIVSVAMGDLDHFKRVNDEHGHAAGDRVLCAVAALLSHTLRRADAVARFGGEEFLLVLPGADVVAATQVAERARKAIEETAIQLEHGTLRVTMSFGVAERAAGEARDATIARADEALYEAKRSGRNRVASR